MNKNGVSFSLHVQKVISVVFSTMLELEVRKMRYMAPAHDYKFTVYLCRPVVGNFSGNSAV